MKYINRSFPDEKITVKEVRKNTVIEHPEYGNISISAGDFILTRSNGPKKGEQIGITKTDLELQYVIADK